MSIQSTEQITRPDAIKKAKRVWLEKNDRQLEAIFVAMSDKELEDYIEETFYNYSIVEKVDEKKEFFTTD